MNPLGVLCARDVTEPASKRPAKSVAAETDIRTVMGLITETGKPVGVEDDGGGLIGQVTRETVLRKLLDPRG
jgi:glycine betaine/proline transport system ATP-binding protein